MTRDDIIRMYEKANGWSPEGWDKTVDELERFAALVAAAERDRLKWDGLHSCHPECDRPACVHTRKTYQEGYEAGRKDENEACAVMTNILQKSGVSEEHLADAIRARREQ